MLLRRHRPATLLSATLLLCFAIGATPAHACTIFTASQGDTALFGNNEDWHSPDLIVGFTAPQQGQYGSIGFGYRHGDGQSFQGRMNDQGLAWDVNSVPRTRLTPHPERPLSHEEDNYLSTITREAATVEEAMRIAEYFDFGEAVEFQIHIADATGDAAVLGPGTDGEMVFTRKPEGDGFLVSTNFSLADADEDPSCWRYETANSMLEDLSVANPLTPEYARDVLDAVHLNVLTSFTLYSNVFDLANQKVYLNYMSQYGETIEIDLHDELESGSRVVDMRDYFSSEIAAAGDEAYQRFEFRFTAAKVGLIAVLAGGVGLGVWLVHRRRST